MSSDAWDQFWTEEQGPGHGGCVPSRGIDAIQRAVWLEFAALVPRHARVIDLATGDGRVMGWLKEARPDLRITGYDLARQLPSPPKGTRSRCGVAMESLPDGSASVDAMTSQFGFEYGRLADAAGEIARVTKPKALVGLMTHRAGGPILAHNRARRQGIHWVLKEALIEKADASLSLRALGVGVPPPLLKAPAEARARFGDRSGAWELTEAISQTLRFGINDHPTAVRELLTRLKRKAVNEIARIDSLEHACLAVADCAGVQRLLETAGLRLCERRLVGETDGAQAFAYFWLLERR